MSKETEFTRLLNILFPDKTGWDGVACWMCAYKSSPAHAGPCAKELDACIQKGMFTDDRIAFRVASHDQIEKLNNNRLNDTQLFQLMTFSALHYKESQKS